MHGCSRIRGVCHCLPLGSRMAAESAEQLWHENRQLAAAQETAAAQDRQLKSRGREAATLYGAAMIREHGEAVREGLELLLAKWANRPTMAGPHYAAIPLLLHFGGRGGTPSIVSVALVVVVDEISAVRSHRRLSGAIGQALERELRGATVRDDSESSLRLLKRRFTAGQITDRGMLRSLGLAPTAWTATDRAEVGALLLAVVAEATGLVEIVTRRQASGRQVQEVRPTADTLARIKASPARRGRSKRLPMLQEPRPWHDLTGGGHLTNTRPLAGKSTHLKAADIPLQLAVVNQLQRQQISVDPWMVGIQRQAWDAGVGQLFPVRREPLPMPPRPTELVGAEGMRQWRIALGDAQLDRRVNGPVRVKVERSIRALEELQGRPVWFAYELDWRGRIYTANREATHQGPDNEKAAIHLQGCRTGETGFEWLLRSAAAHWGERGTWAARLAWGKAHLDELTAAAAAPLDRLELWRDAKDPWQFLQACRAIRQWLADPATPIGCPIRLDQHASGMAIVAALTRDRRLALATRMAGTEPADLYEQMAANVVRRLRLDLEAGPPHHQALAAQWLELGISRSMMKGPTMTTIYGASFWSCSDGLALALEERIGSVAPSQYERLLVRPSQYLARYVNDALKEEIGTGLEVRRWLQAVSKAVVRKQQRIRWVTPAGMPIELGAEQAERKAARTAVSGSRRWVPTDATPGELSARATGRGITANLIHSFDGAFCQSIVSRCGEHEVQVLPTHDCFAAVPAQAGTLHRLLLEELQTSYRRNWLPIVARQIADAAGVALPPPPMVGTLKAKEIGANSYAFS
jgi:DNA-directed RNA polymerase